MTPANSGQYFARVYRESKRKIDFITTVKNNGAFYMYSDDQIADIWEALDWLTKSYTIKG